MSSAIRVYQGNFGRVALLDVDRALVTHAHSQCHILLKASGMDARFAVDGVLQPLTDRTAVLVDAWKPHAYVQPPEGAPDTVFLALYLEPAWLRCIDPVLKRAGQPGFFARASTSVPMAVQRQAGELALQMRYGEQPAQVALESMLSTLAMGVLHGAIRTSGADRPEDFTSYDRRIRRAVAWMQARMGSEFDADRLAREACLSRAQFFKLFQRCTRLTPQVYANALRMEIAVQALAGTEQPLARVSERLGFSAQGHFTRFFRQHLGVMPSQYRRVIDVYEKNLNPSD